MVDSYRMLFVLLNLMLPDPLVEGTLAQELDRHTATVLRQLAFDSRFDNLWQWMDQYATPQVFEATGLPATREALQQYLDAPIPAELVGRKW